MLVMEAPGRHVFVNVNCIRLPVRAHNGLSNCMLGNNFRIRPWLSPRLTHWGQVTHISVSDLTIIGSDNGLSPSRRQAIIWTNVGILLMRPIGTNFSEILIEIHIFSFM